MVTSSATAGPKRHHFVPKAYSRAWADTNGRVAVRRRAADSVYVTAIDNLGVESGLHGSGPLAVHRESIFSYLEDKWPRYRQELTSSGSLHARDRRIASLFIALQIARTREHILCTTFVERLAEAKQERPLTREAVCDFLRVELGADPGTQEVEGAWTLASFLADKGGLRSFDEAFSMSIDVALKSLEPLINALHWRVETVNEPVLWMSDRPVMPYRPPSDADDLQGVGYADCDEIRFPLSPSAMLVMTRRVPREGLARVSLHRFHDYNEDIAAQCHEYVACYPGRQERLKAVRLASHRPPVRFALGRGVRMAADGSGEPIGDIIQSWIPLRANEH